MGGHGREADRSVIYYAAVLLSVCLHIDNIILANSIRKPRKSKRDCYVLHCVMECEIVDL